MKCLQNMDAPQGDGQDDMTDKAAAKLKSDGWTVVGRHGRSQYAFVPSPTRGGMALNLVRRPPDNPTR